MSRRAFPAILLLACLLGISGAGFAEELLYTSNDFGMLLSRIPPFLERDSRWVVKIRRDGSDEDRRLFDNGKEVRRWHVSWNRDKTEKVERETAGGKIAARRVFDASGSLLQEEEYVNGVLSKKTLCSYANGRLTRKRVLDHDGKAISTDVYLYAVTGGLREVRRTAGRDTTAFASVVSGPAGLSEDRSSMGGALFVERYGPDGRMVSRERRVDGKTVFVEDFAHDGGSGVLASSRESRPDEKTLIERRYDDAGRLAQEITTVNGEVTRTDIYERDAKGREISKLRRSSTGLETWKTAYTEAGDVSREEYSKRGILVKAIIHGERKLRTEELYKDGELFLKIFYDGDTRLREEVWVGGTLQRERSYP
jgi:antitoxin component YwqK of YwqJK toxin-antitoxin module